MLPTALLTLLGKIPSLVSGINFSAIGSVLKVVLDNIVKYWQYWLIVLLIGGNLFNGWEWRHTDALLTMEREAHKADIANFKKAQADADAKAQFERAVLLKEAKANAKQADTNYTGLLSKYHASILRYKANQSGTWKPGNNQLPAAQSGNGPSTNTDLPTTITISGDDAQICAVNTARLQVVHDWVINIDHEKN